MWCVYGGWTGWWGFGKVIADRGATVDIRYYPNQQYHNQTWESSYVKQFEKMEDAVKELYESKYYRRMSLEEALNEARERWPEETAQ